IPRPSRAARLIASLESSSHARSKSMPALVNSRLATCCVLEFGARTRSVCARNALVDLRFAHQSQLDAAGEQPIDNLARRSDLDLDDDVGVIATEAAERVGKEIDTGSRRGADVNRATVEAGQSLQLLLSGGQLRQRLTRARSEDATR